LSDFHIGHFFTAIYFISNVQELLALSTALSATLTAQLSFDPKHLKYCSTYNLAEGVDENKKKDIYHLVKHNKDYNFTNHWKRFSFCSTFWKVLSLSFFILEIL
jgi:hypothetical protein